MIVENRQSEFEELVSRLNRARKAGRLSAVRHLLTAAIAKFPENYGLWANLGPVLYECGEPDAACQCFLRALSSEFDPVVFSNLLLANQYRLDSTLEDGYRLGLAYGLALAPLADAAPGCLPRRSGPIRVGYLSDGFRQHPCCRILTTLLQRHSKGFVPYCYPTNPEQDIMTERMRRMGGRWRDLSALTDVEAVAQIRKDGIDLLVETSGHHGPNRLPILARRAAPIQVSLNSFPATLGIPAVDCRITDAIIDPPGVDAYYVERKVIRLSRPANCYFPPSRRPKVNALPALKSGRVTFAAFHRLPKVSDLTVRCWARILQKVPGSRILFHHVFGGASSPTREFRAPLEKRFREFGIPASRLVWIGRRSAEETMQLYNECDIALDPYPFTGAATTLESLWMGVPVVTLAGERPVSRYSASFLTAAGLAGWVTDSEASYVARAVEACSDLPALARLRRQLRSQMRASPLCDGAELVRQIESVYVDLLRDRGER